ncbi:MAG: cupin domain-containing protein [Pseudomonadota bacterium]
MQALAERLNEHADRLNCAASFDVLGDVLSGLRARGSVFFRSQLAAPWGISVAKSTTPLLHLVRSGDCHVGRGGNVGPLKLQADEVVAFPRGGAHWIADRPGRTLLSSEAVVEACVLGAPAFQHGERTHELICANVQFDGDVQHPLLDSLPTMLHVGAGDQKCSSMRMLASLIEEELDGTGRGANVMVDRLVELMFHQLLEEHLRRAPEVSGFFHALREPRLARALGLMHRHLAAPWSLESLAQRAGASRATLARHFKQVLGMAPMDYLTLWRLERSRELLENSRFSLDRVAEEVGYGSSQSFARAFRRRYGHPPGELRRTTS